MQERLLSVLLILCLAAAALFGCVKPVETVEVMPTGVPTAKPVETAAPTEAPEETAAPEQGYRFVDHVEAADLLLSERRYYDNLTQNDLNFRMQKLDATPEELEAFTREQTRDFTEAEMAVIDGAMQKILAVCEERGYHLPALYDVVFAKTTMHEECDAGAYTHGTKIFLGEAVLNYGLRDESVYQLYFQNVVAHELFHCLTRNHPDFRKDIYEILGFTVVEEDYVFPQEIADAIISNPDVGHHNSYAAFEINGVMRNCVVVFTAGMFEKPGDNFFSSEQTCLVPIDTLDVMYRSEDAANFWDVFGRNTGYVIDPEETLADNFAMLMIYGTERDYETPELIFSIDAYLKQR